MLVLDQHTVFFFWLKVYSGGRAACFCRVLVAIYQTAQCQTELTCIIYLRVLEVSKIV
jgi:hypothetical protein